MKTNITDLAVAADPVRAACRWMLDGHHPDDIREALATQFPKADAGAVLSAVISQLAEAGTLRQRDAIRGWILESARDLYRKSVEAGDYKGGLDALKLVHSIVQKTEPRPTVDLSGVAKALRA